MTAVAAGLAILGFLVAFAMFRVAEAAADAIGTARAAIATMRDPTLSEEAREHAVQRASIRLAGSFVSILLRGTAAFCASLAVVFGFEFAKLGRAEDVIAFLSRWDVIILSTTAITAGWLLRRYLAR